MNRRYTPQTHVGNSQQRTPEWFKEREGKLTGSAFGQAASLGPGSRQQLWRRMMGMETFEGNEATEWGTTNEPVAIDRYEQETGSKVDLVGFVVHPSMAWLGCSPDFLVGADGMGEVKCPFSQQVYEAIPPYYMAQVQGALEVTSREWCDFVCWTPTVTRITRVARSPEYWDWLHLKLADFWTWVVARVEPPRAKREQPPPTDHLILSDRLIEF